MPEDQEPTEEPQPEPEPEAPAPGEEAPDAPVHPHERGDAAST